MMKISAVTVGAVLLSSLGAQAQVSETSDLYSQILHADSVLFERGFNECDQGALNEIISDDLTFFHDQNGITLSKKLFLAGFNESICSNPNRKPIRKLVNGSMKVFPLNNEGKLYGAIQTANHEFFIREPGKELYKTNIGLVTNVWVLAQGRWQLRSSLSYDHQDPRPTDQFDAQYPEPIFDQETKILSLMRQHTIPSMAIARIEGGKIQVLNVYGKLDDVRAAPLNTIYNVASLTKPVTALTTLKLVSKGQWDLDEPLAHYFVDPDIAGSPYLGKLTTRMVLSHRTGFPNWRYLTPSKKLSFEFPLGEKYQYSGEGFEYLRKSLEKKFGKGLDSLAQENVFGPLGMRDTHYRFTSAVDVSRFAAPHDAKGELIKSVPHATVNGAANLLTTVGDYATFMTYIMGGAGLSPALYADMLKPQAHVKDGVEYGLGWGIYEQLNGDGEYALEHTGGDDGIKAISIMLPKSKRGLLVISNSENGIVLWKKIIEETFGAAGTKLVKLNPAKP
jgi:CubicO group peptidase (beta-lactamase class C family)